MSRPGRVDLHFHLLPGVDDGPTTVDESLDLAREAAAQGTSTIVCTPHARAIAPQAIAGAVATMQERVTAAGIALTLLPGAELSQADPQRFTDEDLASMAQGPAGRRWLLLEAPRRGPVAELFETVAAIRCRGFAVLLAHPERCTELRSAPELLDRLDVPLQVNGSSLIGLHGPEALGAALQLAQDRRIAVIASDAHRRSHGPSLAPASAVLRDAGLPADVVEGLVSDAPWRLLEFGLPR